MTGRLLEGMGEGEDFAVGAGASDELEADREPLGAESGRHGDRREAGQGHAAVDLHPIDLGLHLDAFDLTHPLGFEVEGEHQGRRQGQEVVVFEEGYHPSVECVSFGIGPGDLL